MSETKIANDTMTKFGYPATLIAAYEHWVVLLRPKQVTLGSLVLACSEPATAFPDASAAAFAELKRATTDLETALASLFSFDKVNYLMLRMVDPHVHFHVLPRYASERTFDGVRFDDGCWPGPPDLARTVDIGEATSGRLLAALREAWPDRKG